jgi:hypothetical protein
MRAVAASANVPRVAEDGIRARIGSGRLTRQGKFDWWTVDRLTR